MADILIRGCDVLTMSALRDNVRCGDIHITDDRLAYVGPQLDAVPQGCEVIDGSGRVALPGFINTHHHLYHPLIRGYSANQDLLQWLQSCVLPTTPHFEPEDLYWGARLSLAECVESGVTSTIDWSYCLHTPAHAAAVLDAIRDSGVRAHYAYGPSLIGGDFDLNFKDLQEIRDRYFAGARDTERITLWAGLGGPNFQPEARVREELECVRGWGLSVHLHLGEHRAQEPKDALRVLERSGGVGSHVLLAHAIHLSDDDLHLLARSGTKVSYNALSNMRLATGVCRATEMWQLGVDVGLGLDSAAGNDNHDYFALMRAALGLQRATRMRGDCLTVHDILEMATIRGAACLGQQDEVGSLVTGKKADLLLIDPRSINFMPVNDFESQLVFCGQPRNVDTVIVDGRVLKRKGEIVNVDLELLMAKCEAAAQRVAQQAGMQRGVIGRRPTV